MKKVAFRPKGLLDLGAASRQTRGELLVTPQRDAIGLYYEMNGIAKD